MRKAKQKPYYLRWVCVAFTHPFGMSDWIVPLIGVIIYLISWRTPIMDVTLWILVGALGGIVLARLLLAPYWIYKELEKERDELRDEVSVAQQPTVSSIFAIEYLEHMIAETTVTIKVGLTVTPTTLVESIQLELMGKSILSDWTPRSIGGAAESHWVNFDIPDWVNLGKHIVKLVAFADGKEHSSCSFTIDFPQR